jgi:hypothetical protein
MLKIHKPFALLAVVALVGGMSGVSSAGPTEPDPKWEIHDMKRPKPPVVTPGTIPTEGQAAPADATVLFDGKNADAWSGNWEVKDGLLVSGKGYNYTKEGFGSCQLHLEWAAPTPPKGESQGRGNSGVFLMSKYEIQVLDNYNNETYADGYAGAVYGQYPPLANPLRPPGEFNVYDIVFHAPKFAEDGKVTEKARVTVFINGVLVQDDVTLTGPSGHHKRPPYEKHADKLPLGLQDHGNPVKFRNIWIRPIGEKTEAELKEKMPKAAEPARKSE